MPARRASVRHGSTVELLTDLTGLPRWTSEVRPGAVHDLTAACELVLPAGYPHAVRGLPVLAGTGYTGAGIDVPIRNPAGGQLLTADTRTRNRLRALAERGVALLKTRGRTLNTIILDPWHLGDITHACLVLTTLERGHY